jgi:anti-sigma-K factor RskA
VSADGHAPARAAEHPGADAAPAYALGALDADERAAFEVHLAGCAACAADVRAHAEVAAALAHAAAGGTPAPPALRARILAEARRSRLTVADGGAAGRPVAPPPGRAAGPRPTAAARVPWLAAAASLVLAAGLGAAWGRERAARARADLALADAVRAAGDRAELARRLAERDSLVAALTEPDVRVARLAATGAEPAMRLTWNRRRGVVIVTASALPAPGPGRTYQLWGIAGRGAPQSLGVFAPDAEGRVRAVLRVPAGAAMDAVAVTEEPAGGSARATTAVVMAGALGD